MVPGSEKSLIARLKSLHFWLERLRDAVYIGGLILVITGIIYAFAGIWPPVVSVGGQSMLPDLMPDDLIFISGLNRAGVITYSEALPSGYRTFGDYGDVIVFRPFGNESQTPVIHRAMYYVEEGKQLWPGGPAAPHPGYVTKGDNNFFYDQSSLISREQPVRKEWVIGVSRFRIPFLGAVRSWL